MLLKALIGELEIKKGSLSINTNSVAYCAQDSWLINASIQQNITGSFTGVPEDPVWYQKVLHSCALDIDLASTADKDQKIVGSGGINMSGGQKQRIVRANTPCAPELELIQHRRLQGHSIPERNYLCWMIFSLVLT
jgi:ABC-type bacteriocin/lantibiotic exporter with double-glycine peptidase domain